MSESSVLVRGRAFARALMTDACTITRPTEAYTDEAGVVYERTAPIYAGPCYVQSGLSPSGQDVAEARVAVLSLTVSVPITVTGVDQGDIVTITSAAHDTELVGRVFRVTGPGHKTRATRRQLQCLEVAG